MSQITARDALSEAVRYWEPRRILFNGVLLGVVTAIYWANLPGARSGLTFDTLQGLFVLAVLANVAYCSAYVADVIVQLTAYRPVWLRFRWALLLVGLVFASILANFFSHGVFAHGP